MKLKVLKCPECRANIEIEEGRTSCFCSYCGCKIIIDDEKSETTINKNININKNITHTERYVNEAEVLEIKTRDKNQKRNVILSIAIPLAAILFFVGIFGVAKHNSNVEEERLQTIVDEVMVDIKNGDFIIRGVVNTMSKHAPSPYDLCDSIRGWIRRLPSAAEADEELKHWDDEQ